MAEKVEYILDLRDLVMSKLDAIDKKFDKVNASAEKTNSTFSGAGKAIGAYFAFDAIKDAAGAILETGINVDAMMNKLKYSEGGIDGANQRFEYLTGLSNRLGLELQSVGKGYSTIAAASKGTSLEGLQTEKIFEGVAEASATLGLSGEYTEGALLAISQMMSKGKVTAEELRGQLGERLPGTMQLLAKSIGVTTAELDKLMSDGKLLSGDVLPKLGIGLHNTFGASAADNVNTLGGATNIYKNELFLLQKDLAETFKPLMISVFKVMGDIFGIVKDSISFIKEYSLVFKGVAITVGLSVVAFQLYTLWQARATIASAALAVQTFITMVATDGLSLAFYAAGISATVAWALATAGLSLIVAGLILAWHKLDWFRGGIMGIGKSFMTTFSNVASFFMKILDPIFKAIDYFKAGNFKAAAMEVGKLGLNLLTMPAQFVMAAINGDLTKGAGDAYTEGYNGETVKGPGKIGKSKPKAAAGSGGGVADSGITGAKNQRIARTYESKVTNITIGKLVEGLVVKVMDTKEIAPRIKEEITKFLLTAVNDANIITN